jgi:alkanesulfonate monooxygenase SsuD/methylene tetrahydromethanopterin reductase-like flavin-dependent oxidoreductase (luciferase family)
MKEPMMQFGVFDHLDWNGGSLTLQYEDRLRIIEALDRYGFHAYHVAEHHGTPSGRAPAPSVFLAAVAQRTRRLRFGPLVYALSMHHPLRVFEEICMLDQMSGGRFELGLGRGISPIENGFYGVDPAKVQKTFLEAQEVIMRACRGGELNFEGDVFQFRDVPIVMSPVQQPHPPLWVGVAKTSSVPWPAANGVNIVATGTCAQVREIVDAYWSQAAAKPGAAPLVGMNRHLVVADTDAEARSIASRCYLRWHDSILHLWRRSGQTPPNLMFPLEYEEAERKGYCIAGTPAHVRERVAADIAATGINYFVCRFAFGDMTREEALRSVDLFSREVMPAVSPAHAAA